MPTTRLSAALARIGQAVASDNPEATDGRLLARFIRTRQEAAFAELVRRLGPMVLGVCRRVTADVHLAEDAFQATFLVLVRRAADVQPREAVRGWLYGVAARTARKARVMSARRRLREVPAAIVDCPAPASEDSDLDALRILDEEVAALPEHLRAAVVLCELDGVARRDAARQLGIPEGTLSSRLAKARQILARGLRKRGIGLGSAGLVCALGQLSSAAVPPRLVSATAVLADGSAPVPAAVAALSQGVLRTMFLTKLKLLAVGGLFIVAVIWVAGLPGSPGAIAGQPVIRATPALAIQPRGAKRPAPKPARPATLLLTREGGVVALSPDGKEGSVLTAPKDSRVTFHSRLSPDGTVAAFVVNTGEPRGPMDDLEAPWPYQIIIRKLGAAKPAAVVDFPTKGAVTLCWAPDGKKVLVSADTAGDGSFDNVLLDAASGKKESIALPAGVQVLDWSRDGKTMLVLYRKEKKYRLGLARTGDTEPRELTELKVKIRYGVFGRLSPDGTKVLFTDANPERKDAFKWHRSSQPYVLEVATREREPLADFPENAECRGVAWSPDGKRVAYTWVQLHPDVLKLDRLSVEDVSVPTEAFLIIADGDGRNQKTVASAKAENTLKLIYGTIDWR